MKTAEAVVNVARSWIGLNEKDGSYKKIIDIYNSQKGQFPRNLKMQYNWSWCACTVSAIAIQLGYEDIIPIEISCGEMVKKAQKMGIWVENDGFVPYPGCPVLYDWDDSGKGDNTGWPDHVGIVEMVNEAAGYFVVIEGNYQNSVKRRTISINGKFIRGFIAPKYDAEKDPVTETLPLKDGVRSIKEIAREVIAGKWGAGETRKNSLSSAGYDPSVVQAEVNKILNGSAVVPTNSNQHQGQPVEKYVKATCYAQEYNKTLSGTYKTTANLYMRNDAGTNKKALCQIPAWTRVQCYGYYTEVNGVKWLYINVVLDGVRYTAFSSSKYLQRV